MSRFDLYSEVEKTGDVPVGLTIAGSDSGGGAGIQADLKTFAACRVFGTSVLTLITAQNTTGVTAVNILDEALIRAQFEAVMSDLAPKAAKTGALGNAETIKVVAELLTESPVEQLVVDPVMISKHGVSLMDEEGHKALREDLLPHAFLVTPKRFEAGALTGRDGVETANQMKEAARRIFDFGAKHVVVKGGHFNKIVRDIYYDGTGFVEFGADRVDSERVHGSGCVFSATITARIAREDSLLDALGFAREFISGAIDRAPQIGGGISPVNPMHHYWR